MSAGPVKMLDAALTGGMNEGIDPTILPPDQLQYVRNARMRKPGRLGKRNGYFQVPLTSSAKVATIGVPPAATSALSGNFCGMGDRLAVVKDTAYSFSQQKLQWRDQFAGNALLATGGGLVPYPFVRNANSSLGHVAGWRCARASFVGYQEDAVNASAFNCDTEYFDGLHWIAVATFSGSSGGTPANDLQVLALDPATDAVVYECQIPGGNNPRLLRLSSTVLVLLYTLGATLEATQFVSYGAPPAGGLAAGFTVLPIVVGTISSTGGFFAIPISATQFLVSYQDGINTIKIQYYTVSATTITAGVFTSFAPTVGGPSTYWTSLAYDGGAAIIMALRNSTDNRITCGFFSLALALTSTEVAASGLVTAAVGRPHCAYRVAGGQATIIYTANSAGSSDARSTIHTVSVTGAAGGSVTREMVLAPKMQLVSQAFFIGSALYCWAVAETESSLQRYLFLLNLEEPSNSKYSVGATVYVPGFELTIQDMLAGYGVELAASSTFGAWLGKTTLGANGYIFAAPFSRGSQSDTSKTTAARLLQVNHYSETVRRRSVNVVPARGAQVMAGGVVSVSYSTGTYELGFLNAPGAPTLGGIAGGGMTAGALYFYALVLRWVNPMGDVERSAPSALASITLAAGQGTVTITTDTAAAMGLYGLGAKSGVCLDVYRSTAGSLFNFVGTVDQSGGIYTDTAADTAVAANGVLYIQVGQELENRAPPACRFLCVSQNRLWCAGLPDSRTIQSSKSFQRGVGISFADDDSFRVPLPDTCTGLAFMDGVVAFTRTAIYIVSGDGPDNSGANGWAPPVALPYPIGCADWRSVIVSEEGVFFLSDRGLYMLPRGFGEPIPAGDMVMEQLRTYAICTGAAAVTRGESTSGASAESTIRWSFCQEEACSHGILVVYDRVHKCWSVDALSNPGSNQNGPAFLATWTDGFNSAGGPGAPGGRMAFALDNTTPQFPSGGNAGAVLVETTPAETAFADSVTLGGGGFAYTMIARTGQIRPFGLFGHGLINRIGALVTAISSVAVSFLRTTDRGVSASKLVTPAALAETRFLECSMDATEGRDVNFLQLELSETSTSEGIQFNGFALDTGEYQGMRNSQNNTERV